MKRTIMSLAASAAFFVVGCTSISPTQQLGDAVKAAGEAYGVVALKNAGAVEVAAYENNAVNLFHLMQGAMTPKAFHDLVASVKRSGAASNSQLIALGVLDSEINDSFVKANGGPTPTLDGSIADAALKQFAYGLGRAVGASTGTEWSITTAAAAWDAAHPPTSN